MTELRGVGPALARTIGELLETGHSRVLDQLRQELPPGVIELTPVLSLRRMTALHDALGITSLAELEAASVAGRVRTVKGFGAKTERRILDAIRALARGGDQVHLHEAAATAESLLRYVRAHRAVDEAEPAGDFRRRTETVNRLDLVVASRDATAVVEHVIRYPAVASIFERGEIETLLRLTGGLHLKLFVAGPDAYPWTLHRATGSSSHLAKLRERARASGLAFEARGLSRGNRRLAVRLEGDVYRHLGLPWIPPELREDVGEVEAALAGTLPDDLVHLEDIRGLVHCHTTYSDGRRSVADMARAADELGMRYITITDHSPTARYAKGLTVDRLKRQWEEIDRVQETVSVRILRATESDILQDGSLDYPDSLLEQMDVVIASIHNRHGMDADAMTERLVRAMRHPLFKIWGHALGRYVLRRPPLACRMERVLEAVAESRAAIEINGDPHRLDLEPRWIREARRYGIMFVVSTDAHSVNGLRNVRWGVDMARRGWLARGEVLNTRDAAEFRSAVHPVAGAVTRAETDGRA